MLQDPGLVSSYDLTAYSTRVKNCERRLSAHCWRIWPHQVSLTGPTLPSTRTKVLCRTDEHRGGFPRLDFALQESETLGSLWAGEDRTRNDEHQANMSQSCSRSEAPLSNAEAGTPFANWPRKMHQMSRRTACELAGTPVLELIDSLPLVGNMPPDSELRASTSNHETQSRFCFGASPNHPEGLEDIDSNGIGIAL